MGDSFHLGPERGGSPFRASLFLSVAWEAGHKANSFFPGPLLMGWAEPSINQAPSTPWTSDWSRSEGYSFKKLGFSAAPEGLQKLQRPGLIYEAADGSRLSQICACPSPELCIRLEMGQNI